MVSMRSEKPICAPPRLSEVSPTLPLKRFQHKSERKKGKKEKTKKRKLAHRSIHTTETAHLESRQFTFGASF